jgi:hypothetical protein
MSVASIIFGVLTSIFLIIPLSEKWATIDVDVCGSFSLYLEKGICYNDDATVSFDDITNSGGLIAESCYSWDSAEVSYFFNSAEGQWAAIKGLSVLAMVLSFVSVLVAVLRYFEKISSVGYFIGESVLFGLTALFSLIAYILFITSDTMDPDNWLACGSSFVSPDGVGSVMLILSAISCLVYTVVLILSAFCACCGSAASALGTSTDEISGMANKNLQSSTEMA